ncbi:MAG TPA: hypothetical protein DCP11_04380 [Microbacteriaceae bacterium]|nr:hypothetical protein [Microbacteriaceae bacterium]
MSREQSLAVFRFFFAALGFAGLLAQYLYNLQNIPAYKPVNFFSFFTVESNIIAVVSLALSGAYILRGAHPRWVEYVRGAATIYMTITGIVYGLLLRNVEVDTAVPWVNTVLHFIIPVAIVIDWLIDLPQFRIHLRQALVWLIFPILYLAYSLVRGPFADWYPYPFLDPRTTGYGSVIVTSIAIAIGGFFFAWLQSWTTSLRIRFDTRVGTAPEAP